MIREATDAAPAPQPKPAPPRPMPPPPPPAEGGDSAVLSESKFAANKKLYLIAGTVNPARVMQFAVKYRF